MKRVYLCLSGVFLTIAIFSMIFYVGYQNEEEKQNLAYQEQMIPTPDSVTVDTAKELRVHTKMQYILEQYEDNQKITSELQKGIPASLVGKNREELLRYLQKYTDQPSFVEQRKGFLSFELISMSDQELILRKTYSKTMVDTSYFVKEENGQVRVYYPDRKNIYDDTGILTSELDEAEQIRLKIGYTVGNEEELYAILESYSS